MKNLVGIFSLDSMVNDCKIVDIPPKLMTNEARVIAKNLLGKVAKSMQPFVISKMPSRKQEMLLGRIENNGAKHSIIIKKIVIIEPTDRMAKVESKTMFDKSKGEFAVT